MSLLPSARSPLMAALLPFFAIQIFACSDASMPISEEPESVNLLLITLDTVRADFLGSYGHPESPTPNLDRLAGEGVRFDNAISTASVTPVAHASILTGRNPYAHGVRVISADGGFRLQPEIPSLALILKAAGFRTGAVHSSFTVSGYFGFAEGFDSFESFEDELSGGDDFKHWKIKVSQRRADASTDLAIDFLDAGPEPFFLWLHYWDMHDPFLLPPDDFMPAKEKLWVDQRGTVKMNRDLYAAEIRFMDHHLGRLVEALAERGLDRNTLIAVVADHGEGLGDHGWRYHRMLYQEQIRVPLILRIPEVSTPNEVENLVRNIDVFPTVLDYLGKPLPDGVEGRSLRPLIEGQRDEPRIAYSDQLNLFDKNSNMIRTRKADALLFSAQDQSWKLIYKPLHPDRSELYHVSEDPNEKNNLFAPDHPQTRRLLEQLAVYDGWVLQPPTGAGMDAAAREQLEALGYLEGDGKSAAAALDWSHTPVTRFDREHFTSRAECERASGATCVPIRTPVDAG